MSFNYYYLNSHHLTPTFGKGDFRCGTAGAKVPPGGGGSITSPTISSSLGKASTKTSGASGGGGVVVGGGGLLCSHGNSGSATTTIGNALDDMMCGKMDGNLSSGSSNVSPNSVFFSSILHRDLNLSSEDSDADQLSEDNKTSASQSKKGKVIGPTARKSTPAGGSSSSSNSSSDSSSDSGGDDNDGDDGDKTTAKGKVMAKDEEGEDDDDHHNKKGKGPRLSDEHDKGSSSTSNSSSDSSSESGSEDEEEERHSDHEAPKEKVELKLAVEREEKTPSPPAKHLTSAPSSVSPNAPSQEQGDDGAMNWGLGNFLKKSLSPASASPFKSPSPAASISHRDEASGGSSKQGSGKSFVDVCGSPSPSSGGSKSGPSQKAMGRSFSDLADSDNEDFPASDKKLAGNHSDGDDEDEGGPSSETWKSNLKKKKSPSKENKQAGSLDTSRSVADPPSASKTSKNGELWKQSRKTALPNFKGKLERSKPTTTPHKKKHRNNMSLSSSEDEIDVVNFTPDQKGQQRSKSGFSRGVSNKHKDEVAKTLFSHNSSDSEPEDSKKSVSSPPSGQKKEWRKAKSREPIPRSSSQSPASPAHSSNQPPEFLTKSPRKLVSDNNNHMALNHLDSICKPVNLLSPLHSGCSPSPSSSNKPLPPFHKSFSPASQSAISVGSPSPVVTLSNSGEPQIIVRIRLNAFAERKLNRLKERRSRKLLSTRGKLPSFAGDNAASSSSFSPPESRLEPDAASKGHRVPPIDGDMSAHLGENKDSTDGGGSSGSSRKISSSSLHTTPGSASSKPPKRKMIDPGGDSGHPPPPTSSSSSSSSSLISSTSLSSSSTSRSPSLSSHPFHKLPKSSKTSSKESLPPPSSSSPLPSSPPSASSLHSTSGPLLTSEAAPEDNGSVSQSSSSSSKKSASNSSSHYHEHHNITHSKKTPPDSEAGSKRSSSSASNSSDGVSSSAKIPDDLGASAADSAADKADSVAANRPDKSSSKEKSKGSTSSTSSGQAVDNKAAIKRRLGEASCHEEEPSSSSSSNKRIKAETAGTSSSIAKAEKPNSNNGHLTSSSSSVPDVAQGTQRRDSNASNSSRSSHKSSSSAAASAPKKPRRPSSSSLGGVGHTISNENKNSIDIKPDLNARDQLPFNHYVNGTTTGSASSSTSTTTTGKSNSTTPNHPPPLPQPIPMETPLKTSKEYLCRAKEHKHRGDRSDDYEKLECYLRAGLNYFLAGYSIELSRSAEQSPNSNIYEETLGLLQFAIRHAKAHGERGHKFTVLVTRLQSFLNHRMYRLRKREFDKLKKIMDTEQTKPTTSVTAPPPGNSSKPHAPSPHQSSWNKNSTGTPSPMSPTPSPGSVSSQGSCELMSSKLPNGSAAGVGGNVGIGSSTSSSLSMNTPSPCMVSIPQRVYGVRNKYIHLSGLFIKAGDLWDQATADSRGLEDFFSTLDNACGPLTFHSDPQFVVHYMKYALRLLS